MFHENGIRLPFANSTVLCGSGPTFIKSRIVIAETVLSLAMIAFWHGANNNNTGIDVLLKMVLDVFVVFAIGWKE